MKKLSLLLIVCAFAVNASADIHKVFADRFQFILDSVCKKNNIKGVSAAIYIPGGGIWKGAYGISEVGVPLSTDMYLPIGSNTKTFTSAIILKLQENSQLNLDDTIGTWIQNQPNISGKITIRQMLNHTSGLYNYTNHPGFFTAMNNDYNKVWAPEDMLQFVDVPTAQAPAAWEYCNTNYLLLGMIIKQVTGQPLHKAYRDLVCTPNSLDHTVFFPDEQPQGTIPHGWTEDQNGMIDMQLTYNYTNTAFMSMANSAGSILSTAEDNVKFWNALMTGKIISNNSLNQMRTFIKITNNYAYGLGLMRDGPVNGHIVFDHGGTCFGYLNENLYDSTTGVCITVLSNQDSVGNNLLFERVVKALHKATLQMPPAGVEDVLAEPAVKIFPNPANHYVAIETNHLQHTFFELYDMTGRVVISQALAPSGNKVPLDGIGSGLYIGRVTQNGQPIHNQRLQVIK